MSLYDENEKRITGLTKHTPAEPKARHVLEEIEKTDRERNGARFIGDRKEFERLTKKLIRLWKSI